MKKNLLGSYWAGIKNKDGSSFTTILNYFAPELISALVIYSLPYLLDELFIAQLKSASTYAAVGLTNSTLIHLLTKIAEGIAVGITIATGIANGAGHEKAIGGTFVQSIWVTLIVGAVISFSLFFGANWLLFNYGYTQEMILVGVPFLKLKSFGVFLNFVLFSIIGFLRGLKNTKTPMYIFLVGAMVFVFCDYLFIFGKFGLEPMGFIGSAWASIVQQITMIFLACFTVYKTMNCERFALKFYWPDFLAMCSIFNLSWPIIIDKAMMSLCYIWLGKMISPMGTAMLATYTVIKNIERFAFLPAIAGAQIITFLSSNLLGAGQSEGVKSTIKKTILISTTSVFVALLVISIYPNKIVSLFDKTGTFTHQATKILPIISVFVLFDVVQLILSAALRGISQVRLVMNTRILLSFLFFIPLTFVISNFVLVDSLLKFLLLYGTFYISSALMACFYVYKFRSMDSTTIRKLI
jgi:MATE family multidrug resistance protein